MITLSYPIAGGDFDSAGFATRKLKEQLAKVGVDASALRRAMIAAYEAEMNVVIHARVGTLWARLDETKLDLEVADEGPGIPDVELAMREGWSTAPDRARQMGFGAGLGLPNIRKASDLFQIETRVGRGTRIRSTILFDGGARAAVEIAAAPALLRIEAQRCRGCMRCIRACPAGALRIHNGRPVLLQHLCIGCATCIDECADGVFGLPENGAPRAVPKGAILIIPRGLVTGFPGFPQPESVVSALRELGFEKVMFLEEWEEALCAEGRKEAADDTLPLPRIPPLCPPLVALIESRFPSLIPHLSPFLSPAESAGEEFPLRPVFLVAACPGQYSACAESSLTERLTVLAPAALTGAVRNLKGLLRPASRSLLGGSSSVVAARSGELAAGGARAVMRVLGRAETGALGGIDLLDLHFCAGGCSASPLVTREPEIAGLRHAAVPRGAGAGAAGAVRRTRPYVQRPGLRLDPDMAQAMRKLALIDSTVRLLPGRDCGSCGAPSCAALAEDVVAGRAHRKACPFLTETER